jgi:hypothetical protein
MKLLLIGLVCILSLAMMVSGNYKMMPMSYGYSGGESY